MRLFAGIALAADARAYVAAAVERLKGTGFQARWVRAENWHITLAFLGDIDTERAHAVTHAFEAAARRCEPFSLQLSTFGAFPNARRPRVLWVGAPAKADGFAKAAAQLREAFTTIGFTFDDDAVAHVTIGRTDGRTQLDATQLDTACECQVTRLSLFESVRTAAGTSYIEREVVAMGNA